MDKERLLEEVIKEELDELTNGLKVPDAAEREKLSWASVATSNEPEGSTSPNGPLTEVDDGKGITQPSTTNRKIVELCCGKNSRFCRSKWVDTGCHKR